MSLYSFYKIENIIHVEKCLNGIVIIKITKEIYEELYNSNLVITGVINGYLIKYFHKSV